MKSKVFDFFPFGRTLKQNLYCYFNPINNEEKNETERLFCFSHNVVGLVFVSEESQKIENRKLKSIFNF